MKLDDPDGISQKTEQALDEVLREVLLTPDHISLMKSKKRARLGVELMAFGYMVGAIPVPSSDFSTKLLWALFSLVLLIIFGWEIFQSRKEKKKRTTSLGTDEPPPVAGCEKKKDHIRIVRVR